MDQPAARLTLLHTNDTHGKIEAQRRWGLFDVGGVAMRSALVREIRAGCAERGANPVLLLDGGDILECDPASHFFRGEPDILAMNRMGYDAMTIGNHDLGFSLVALERLRELADFPFLSCNLRTRDSGRLIGRAGVIKSWPDLAPGLAVGIVGATSWTVTLNVHGDDADRIAYEDPVEPLRREVAALRARGATLVVFLSHLGIEEDRRVVPQVAGIDLVVGSHSHSRLTEPEYIGGVPMVQAGRYSEHMGRVDLDLTAAGRPAALRYRLLEVGDRAMGELVKGYHERLTRMVDVPIGHLDRAFGSENKYEKPAPLNQLMLELIRARSGADCAMATSISVGGTLGPGWVRLRDLYDCMPFDNSLTVLRIAGADLLRFLAYRAGTANTMFHTQVNGVEFGDDPGGSDARIAGRPIDPARTYTIATDNYLASGGGKDDILPKCPREGSTILFRDLLRAAVASGDVNRLHAASLLPS